LADFAVHNLDVEIVLCAHFELRGLEPTGLFGSIFRPAADETSNQFFPAGRQEKDKKGFRHLLAHRACPLQVDLEEDTLAGLQRRDDGRARCSVARGIVDGGVLE
jgi:hypothetical protein